MSVHLDSRWRIVDRHEALRAGVEPARLQPLQQGRDDAAVYQHAGAWAEEDLGSGWVAAYRLAAEKGRPVVVELRVFPNQWVRGKRPEGAWSGDYLGPDMPGIPAGGLSATTIRRATLGRSLRSAIEAMGHLRRGFPGVFDPRHLELDDLLAGGQVRTTRARKLDLSTLARIAQVFVKSGSLSETAKRFKISESTARGRVELARQRGLLTRPGHGFAGISRLTPAAEELLGRRKS